MRKLTCVFFLVFFGTLLQAQSRFRPYSSHGVELGLSFSALATNPKNLFLWNKPGAPGSYAEGYNVYPEIKWNYDYAPLRYLGVGSGLGLSVRGGGNDRQIVMYYLNLPLRAQLKSGFFWFEPGLQANLLLGSNNQTNSPLFSEDYIKRFNLTYTLAGRFNLFKGLSLHAGMEGWFTPLPSARAVWPSPSTVVIDYYQFSFIIGGRYMFNQPARIKR